MSVKANLIRWYSVERILAVFGLAACLVLTTVIWLLVGQQQPMWPLPAVYLIEVVALAAVATLGVILANAPGRLAAWAAVGALIGFGIIGGFSVGFFYMPIATLLGLAALWLDRSTWRSLPLHLGVALVAAVAQATLMLAVVGLLFPSAAF